MDDLVRVILVYKSGLAFFLTAKTKKLAIYSTVQYSTPVLNFCTFLTLVLDELQGHVLHQIRVEFHQECNGHGPRHMTRVCHVSTRELLTPDPFELQTSVRGQNELEFHWESNGHGPRHVTRVLHVLTHDF